MQVVELKTKFGRDRFQQRLLRERRQDTAGHLVSRAFETPGKVERHLRVDETVLEGEDRDRPGQLHRSAGGRKHRSVRHACDSTHAAAVRQQPGQGRGVHRSGHAEHYQT